MAGRTRGLGARVVALGLLLLAAPASPALANDETDDARQKARALLDEFDGVLHVRTEDDARRDLRRRFAEIDRDALANGDWLDLHIALAALDRRLESAPEPKLGDDVPDPGAASDDPFDATCHAVGLVPVGRAAFAYAIRHRHDLDLTPEAVVRLGEMARRECARELERHATRHGNGRSWRELAVMSQDDHPTSQADLLEHLRRMVRETADAIETAGLVTVPQAARGLAVYAAARATAHPFAAYQPASRGAWGRHEARVSVQPVPTHLSPEGADAWLREFDVHWLRVIAAHEGVPGHHLQQTRARGLRGHVRPHGFNATFMEGWAFYCEDLAARATGESDPMDRLARLRMRAWRAVRCYADAALHTGRIAPSEAVRLMVDEAGLSERAARLDVRAILRLPARAFGYWVGRRLIETLHDEYVRRNGPGTEREFHDRLLSFGTIPIPLIEAVLLERRRTYDALHP